MKAIIICATNLVVTGIVTLGGWYLMTTPYASTPLPEPVHRVMAKTLAYPVDFAARVTGHSMMCCFCSEGQAFRQWIRVAVPTYALIICLPMILASLAAGSRD